MIENVHDRTLVKAVLVEGLDDWVDDAAVFSLSADDGTLSHDDRRAMALGAIAELLIRGWMTAGSVTRHGFTPWEGSTAEIITRIATTWLTDWTEEPPTPGAVVWLSNTDAGDAIARAAFEHHPQHYTYDI